MKDETCWNAPPLCSHQKTSQSRSSDTSSRGSAVCSRLTVVCWSVIPGRSLRNRYSRFLRGITNSARLRLSGQNQPFGGLLKRTDLSLCSAMTPLSVTFPHDTTSTDNKLS